ncbi:hypothetical protein Pfo_022415 [Paulownia fortunei]|nr:hypothetical protein Pfo_022415 [Paulownia fortunei]
MLFLRFDWSHAFPCPLVFETYNEVQHCFPTVGQVYPEDVFAFLLCVLHHLASLFLKNIILFCKDEFVAESLDVIQDGDSYEGGRDLITASLQGFSIDYEFGYKIKYVGGRDLITASLQGLSIDYEFGYKIKVCISTVEALPGLVTQMQLKSVLPRFVSTILEFNVIAPIK